MDTVKVVKHNESWEDKCNEHAGVEETDFYHKPETECLVLGWSMLYCQLSYLYTFLSFLVLYSSCNHKADWLQRENEYHSQIANALLPILCEGQMDWRPNSRGVRRLVML